MEASIALKNVSKHFNQKYVLSNLTLGIEKGSTFAIIGRNGAGKSTLLRILSTLMDADHGTIYIKGQELSKSALAVKPFIGYLPDHDIQDPWLTGWQNLQQRAAYLGLSEDTFKQRAEKFISLFELESCCTEYPVTYSHGEKRRLDIVQILLGDPEILLMDEPLLGLDYKIRHKFIQYLMDQKSQKTIVLASNEFTEIQTIADRWIVLHKGQIRFDGTLEKMTSQLQVPFIGNIELKTGTYDLIHKLPKKQGIREVRDYGNTIQIVTNHFQDFYQLIKKIGLENVIRISGNSINIVEFLNQLLSEEEDF